MANRVLGRGLASLIPNKVAPTSFGSSAVSAQAVSELSLDLICPNPHQPRKRFPPDELRELAESIKEHGVLQPVVVSRIGERYELIAGERRCQASRLAGKKTIPALVRAVTEQQKLEVALIENIQRRDLNPLEESLAYQKLFAEFNLTQEDIAIKVGKSRSYVANAMRLLSLPEEIRDGLASGEITTGHAKAILSLATAKDQLALYQQMRAGKVTVRDAEEVARGKKRGTRTGARNANESLGRSVADMLREHLGTKVATRGRGSRGRIVIEYYSQAELKYLTEKILGRPID